ncbi:MAG: leucine-rich repeat protein, partial [Muribaculaceae bacterium]|nr:leucine-rich repeat protein [Muribaculaceae bacterium]
NLGDYAFQACSALTSIEIPESLAESGYLGYYTFAECSLLKKAILPDSMKEIPENMFSSCTTLTHIHFPESLEIIRWNAFMRCNALSSVCLPDRLRILEPQAFHGCRNLTTVFLPDSLEEIGHYEFYDCNNLMEIYCAPINPIVPDEIIFSEDIYSRATLYVREEALEAYRSTEPWCNFEKIEAFIPSKSEIESVTLDPTYWYCEAGESFRISATVFPAEIADTPLVWTSTDTDVATVDKDGIVTTVGPGSCLISARAEGSYVSGVCRLSVLKGDGPVFTYEGLRYAVLDEHARTCRVAAYNDVEGDLVIPASVIYDNKSFSVVKVGAYAFPGNTSLKSVRLPDGIEELGEYAFTMCDSLQTLDLPDGITEIPDNLCYGCTSLTSISIPDRVWRIGKSAFYFCNSLIDVSLGNELKTIDEGAFAYCSMLKVADLPASLTSIEFAAFQNCKNLPFIKIPKGVKKIGERAFYSCGHPSYIYIPASVEEFGLYAFDFTETDIVEYDTVDPIAVSADDYSYGSLFYGSVYRTATLRMPEKGLEKAKLIWPWCEFSNMEVSEPDAVEAISDCNDTPVEVYTLSGIRVDSAVGSLAPGCYIVRKGNESRKILIK